MSRVALLDVNLLVALFDPDHVHHEPAHDWFDDGGAGGWATCPLTENGFVRVITNPAYGLDGMRADAVAARLRRFASSRQHHFWPDGVSLCDESVFNLPAARGHRQLTDVYLLGLAVKMKGCLATFDRGIPLKAVKGARPEHLLVVGAGG